MTHFLGSFVGRLDKKGRISVPAPFRAAMERLGFEDLVFRPSHKHAGIEAWPLPYFDALSEGLDTLDAFSDAHEDLRMALYSDVATLRPDGEGRIVLPESLIVHAGLTEAVKVLGLGRTFQLWDPAAADRRAAEAKARARERGLTVPAPAVPVALPGARA